VKLFQSSPTPRKLLNRASHLALPVTQPAGVVLYRHTNRNKSGLILSTPWVFGDSKTITIAFRSSHSIALFGCGRRPPDRTGDNSPRLTGSRRFVTHRLSGAAKEFP
jgi:hypothetical protein